MDAVTTMLLLLGVALAIAIIAGVLAVRAVDRRIASKPDAGAGALDDLADVLGGHPQRPSARLEAAEDVD